VSNELAFNTKLRAGPMGTLQPTHELFSEQIRDSNLGNVTRIQPMGGGGCENEPVQSADSCDKSGREL